MARTRMGLVQTGVVRLGLAGGLLLAAGVQHAHAQAQRIDDTDKAFLQDQAQGTSYEMAIAQLALQKAERPEVRAYAQAIIADHSQLDSQLEMVARIKGVVLPTAMTSQQKTSLARLQGLGGKAFDEAYEQETVRINGKDKADDAKELDTTKDETIRQFVQQLKAADEKHFAAGEQLKQGG